MEAPDEQARTIYLTATRDALAAVDAAGRGDVDALVPIIAADAAVLAVATALLDAAGANPSGVLVDLVAIAKVEQLPRRTSA